MCRFMNVYGVHLLSARFNLCYRRSTAQLKCVALTVNVVSANAGTLPSKCQSHGNADLQRHGLNRALVRVLLAYVHMCAHNN